jgi:transcriptional regulator
VYTPPAFRMDDTAEMHAVIDAARLATLVSNGPDGLPLATHLPLMRDGETIIGHLARANDHWRALAAAGRALAIFPGSEAYVSPSLYAAKREHGRVVPTWNYVAVHAAGPVQIIEEAERLHAIVDTLTRRHEAARPQPWAVDDAPAPFVAGQLKGIVGVVLRIERLTGKRKLSQNRSQADQDGVASGLAASEDARDRAVAHAMRGA